jgi:ankyrin repeat protein
MIAAGLGSVDAVRCLLQHQPDLLDTRDDMGRTALFLALQNNNLEVASALLEAGADANIPDLGTTTLMVCSDVAIARRLLELGVDINVRDLWDYNAFLHACQNGYVEMASFLATAGAETYVPDAWESALYTVCRVGLTDAVALLLSPGDAPDRSAVPQQGRWLRKFDDCGQTALHAAVKGGHVGCVQALIDAGFAVGAEDKRGVPALYDAEDVEVARILLDAGAGESASTDIEVVMIRACRDPARTDVLRLLLQRFPDSHLRSRSLLFFAVKAGNPEAVRLLLATQPPGYVNIKDSCGRTAMLFCNHAEVMRLLLDAAPDLVNVRDSLGWNAVMRLSNDGHHDVLKELFRCCEEHGIDAGVNQRTVHGETALGLAAKNPSLRVGRLLLEKGADVLPSGDEGMTVLMKPFANLNVLSDDEMSVWLRMVLDAVLLRGGEAAAGAGGGTAEENREPATKRR